MIRAIIAALLLIVAAPSLAQEYGPYGEQAATYPEIDSVGDANALIAGTSPVLGDGTTQWGGTPPALSYAPTLTEFPTDYADGTFDAGSVTGQDENKFRITCSGDRAIVYRKDSIKGKGQSRFGHLHYFYGALAVDENTTTETLRARAGEFNPTCPGQGLWNNAYWLPAIIHPNARGDGIARVKKIDVITIYYVCPPDPTPPTKCVDLPAGLQFIGGTDVDDPNETARQAEIAAASAASSYTGYTREFTDGPIRPRWTCINTGVSAPYLKTAAGVDALGNCPSTSLIRLELSMQQCWDGKNLQSPGGRKHVRYYVLPVGLGSVFVCPTGWYVIPQIEYKFDFSHRGWSDYGQWYASSDPTTTAATGIPMGAGESVHVDWVFGMDPRVAADIHRYCMATKNSPDYRGACNGSTISMSPDRSLDATGMGGFGPFTGDNDNDWISIPNEGSNKRMRMRRM